MGRYKKNLVQDIQAQQIFMKEQEELKEKHKLDTDKIIVEKSNMAKFTVKTFVALVKTAAAILVYVLAAVGLLAMIYPSPRRELMTVGETIYLQLQQYISFLP